MKNQAKNANLEIIVIDALSTNPKHILRVRDNAGQFVDVKINRRDAFNVAKRTGCRVDFMQFFKGNEISKEIPVEVE